MELQDKLLHCAKCNAELLFTAGEQQFFLDRQFRNQPRYCKKCKIAKRGEHPFRSAEPGRQPSQQPVFRQAGGTKAGGTNKMVTAVYCASCGQKTTVPFRPTQGRPVLCRACYMGQRNVASA